MLNSTFKLLKLRTPIAVYSCFDKSNRKETLLHVSKNPNESFIYCATVLWNKFLTCKEGYLAKTFMVEIGCLKSKTKELILRRQNMGDRNEWHDDINFQLQ